MAHLRNAKSFWHTIGRPIIALAPMEGYTDSPFRRICKRFGADVVYTEFVSSDALARSIRTTLDKLRFDPSEQPVVCQIFGSDIDAAVTASREIEARGFSGIDINLGCPARKVIRKGAGAALMRDPQYARKLIGSIADAVRIPISIKLRSSINASPSVHDVRHARYTALDIIEALNGLPVEAVMIHGRTFEKGFTGNIDTDMIRAVTQKFRGIVLANGGVHNADDARVLLEKTGADGIGIARGSIGSPWIFRSIRSMLLNTRTEPVSVHEWQATVESHLRSMIEYNGQHGLLEFRKHLTHYLTGFKNASRMRSKAVLATTVDGVLDIVRNIAADQEEWASV